jgi:MFS family permease
MVYPLLSVFLVGVLGTSPAILGLVEGVAESLASLLKVFSGYFSDKIKLRKPVTILGYSSSTVGKLFLYLAISWPWVFLSRVIDRLGKGIRTAPRDALIAENAKANKRGAAFGLHRTMDTFGASIGVLLSYFLILYFKGNLRMIFLLSLIPAFLGILFLFLVKERAFGNKLQEKEKVKFNWAGLDRRLKIFLIFSFIFSLGNSSNQFLLLRAKNMGNPLTTVILLYLVYNLTYALASYPASRLSDKIGRKKILVAGYIFYAIVYFGFAVNNSLNTLWLLFALYGLYIGFTEGVEKALIIDISPSNLRATTIGLHATVVGIALLPASLLAGILWNVLGASAPFYFGGLMGLAASIGFWFILRGL